MENRDQGARLKVAGCLISETSSQGNKHDSLMAQEKAIRDYVKEMDRVELTEIYKDDGGSDMSIDHPSLQSLFSDAEAGKFHVVLVSSLPDDHPLRELSIPIFILHGRIVVINGDANLYRFRNGEPIKVNLNDKRTTH